MSAPCDFKDQITGEVSIPPSWQKKITQSDEASQTATIATMEEAAQTDISALQVVNRLDKKVGHDKRHIQATLNGLQYIYAGVEFDEGKLAAFLESARDDILSMLYRNAKSSAFDNYEPNWSSKSTDIAAVATLSSAYAVEGELHALAVSWNCNGTLLAVGYGRVDTVGWCHSTGLVGIWNLSRRDMDVNTPHHTLETDSFVTSVAFHPMQAAVLAVGLYSGEVVVYANITDNIPTAASTEEGAVSHREPVTSLQWAQSAQAVREPQRYILCSAAQDGCVLFWTTTNKLTEPIASFSVQNKKGVTVGVEAASFTRPDMFGGVSVPSADSLLILGLENGDVGRARPGVVAALTTRATDIVMSLDIDWLDAHRGPIQSVDTSPFFHNLCLTCSSDGSAHLYNVLERVPLATLEPSAESKHFIYAARFSPFRPSVVGLVSRSSFLHIYDLQKTKLKPIVSLEAGVDGAPVMCVAFNHVLPDWLVTGDVRGCVRLWRLPSSLIQATDMERAAVRSNRVRGGDDAAVRSLFGFTF